jgi:hypothetical protein
MNTFIILMLGALILILSSAAATGLAWLDCTIIGAGGYLGCCLCYLLAIPAFLGAVSGMAAGAHSRRNRVWWVSAAAGGIPGALFLIWFLLSIDVQSNEPYWRKITSLMDVLTSFVFFLKPPALAGTLSGVLVPKLLKIRAGRDR